MKFGSTADLVDGMERIQAIVDNVRSLESFLKGLREDNPVHVILHSQRVSVCDPRTVAAIQLDIEQQLAAAKRELVAFGLEVA